jgi:salicylate hydroxylase
LQKCLISGALDSGVVNLHLGRVIEDWDFDSTSFSVTARKSSADGNEEDPVPEWIKSDVILASDGVKSKARAAMMGRTGEKDDGKSFLGVDSASSS